MSITLCRHATMQQVAGGAPPTGYPGEVAADSPISYWRLGESSGTTAEDEQNANDGTYTNTPTLGAAGALFGDANTAVTFNSTDEYVVCNASRIVSGLTNWTIELWFKTTDGSAAQPIYCERGASGNDIVKLELDGGTPSHLRLTYRDTAGTLNQPVSNNTVSVHDDVWHHAVITKAGTAIAFYLDGVARGTATLTASDTFSTANQESRIASDKGGSQFYGGSVDEVALYNTTLSAGRVQAHYFAAFSPDDLSGMVSWLKADAITGLSDGDPVTTWEDSSSANNDATQTTSAQKPTYKTSIVNSLPVVRFDGTDDFMNLPDLSALSTAVTGFIVVKNTGGAATEAGVWKMGSDSLSSHTPFSDGTFYDDFGSTVRKSHGAASLSTFKQYGVVSAASDYRSYIDGASLLTTGTNTVGMRSNPKIGVGRENGTQYRLNGDIAEVIIYDSALSDANRKRVEGYLRAKYGLA